MGKKNKYSDEQKKKMGSNLRDFGRVFLNFSNFEMAKELGYPSENYVSQLYSGTRQLPDDLMDKLVEKYKISKNYLLGLCDSWYGKDFIYQDISNYHETLRYLETLGLKYTEYRRSNISLYDLYNNMDKLKPYIKNNCLKQIMKQYDFSLTYNEFYKSYYGIKVIIEYEKLPEKLEFSFNNVGKSQKFKRFYYLSSDDSPTGKNIEYEIGYKISYNDKYLGEFSITNLQNFMSKIDSFNKCAIETLLPTEKKMTDLFDR